MALGVLVVLGIGAIVLSQVFDDTTTPVDADDVLRDFREDQPGPPPTTTEPTAPVAATPTPSPALPADGVYTYATTGGERVSALGGASHDYPATTTITVRGSDCGVTLRWDALVERTETMEVCVGADGVSVIGYTALHRFFGQDDRQQLVCASPLVLVPAAGDAPSTAICANEELREDLTATTTGRRTVTIGGDEVEVVDVVVDVVISPVEGSTSGTSTSRYSFAVDSGVLVAWGEITETVADSAIGDVRYEEEFELELVDLDPLR